ncbi:elongation factor P maturation arginine rhamnosyltransferase EarP [Chitinilyticum piscinae]|uniref:Protein-arginine rhamnosyltransferase n=1 Tax=Chitinilyticum piscinae TaxID=2866724 RepID=A0A8J7G2D9_9NEIS|nr:elongation factor P maturation arginine rhamnosyltransferase EarP [Chitinilyticum piscinae]MBE9610700.1 elongation factor P maturation arginine rhamnosyltransferase EarP [Chitinilyticum piscinae]
MTTAGNWDIFCKVVDNYGDIGVCWRLARQLAGEYGISVRLWVDDLASFARIAPQLDPAAAEQFLDGVMVCLWAEDFTKTLPAPVVIEAFACALPAAYRAAMPGVTRCWLNLEYLSAEDWVEGCHGLGSPQGQGLNKYFFFPGFSAGTGGLLQEQAAQHERERWHQADSRKLLARFAPFDERVSRNVSLFAYPNRALPALLDELVEDDKTSRVYVPDSLITRSVAEYVGGYIDCGSVWQRDNLQIVTLPMLAQADYDRLLWSCDANFVRGEDSFVRAQWAGKPLIWHIYRQDENTHLEKLAAWQARYLADCASYAASAQAAALAAWNRETADRDVWRTWLRAQPDLALHARSWAKQLAQHGNLAGNLVSFVGCKV